MDKRLQKYMKLRDTSNWTRFILPIYIVYMNLFTLNRDYDGMSRLLFFWSSYIGLIIVLSIVNYYGDLMVNDNNLFKLIPVTRENILKNYIYSINKLPLVMSLIFSLSLVGIDHLDRWPIFLVGLVFFLVLMISFETIGFSLVAGLAPIYRSRGKNFTRSLKYRLSFLVLGLEIIIFLGVYLLARFYPLLMSLNSFQLIKPQEMIGLRYKFIADYILVRINQEYYLNLSFLLSLILVNLLLVLINIIRRRRWSDEG